MKIHGPGGWLDCAMWALVALAVVVLAIIGIVSSMGEL